LPLFEEVARMTKVQFFEEKLEELKTATNDQGRQWLRELMRERDKWTMAYDDGGVRYEFQTSNMVESFNSVLKGIRGMHVNAIVSFTFYRLVAWFNERYSHAMALHSKNQLWAPKPLHHLDKAKDRDRTHEVECFDHTTGKYKVTERGDTTSNGKVRPSRSYIVVLINFSCTCGRTRQYHFPCSHYVAAAQHHNYAYESKISREFSVDTLVLTWSPRFEPYLDEGQWPPYTGPKYVVHPGCRWNKCGTRKRTRHKMVMDQVSGRTTRGRATPFLCDPEQSQCGRCNRVGHNSRRCSWSLSQDGATAPPRSVLRAEPPRTTHRGNDFIYLSQSFIFMFRDKYKKFIVCRNRPFFVLEPMTCSKTWPTDLGTSMHQGAGSGGQSSS